MLLSEITHWPIERTYREHMNLMDSSKHKKGCIRKPVVQIEPTSCPPDVLYMKKGIISKLINQLVDWVILQGKEQVLLKEMKQHKIPFT